MFVTTAIVLAAAFVVRMGMRGAVSMGMCVIVIVLMVVTTAIVFAAAFVMRMAVLGAIGMGILRDRKSVV